MPGQALNEATLQQLLEGTGSAAPGWYGKLSMLGDFANRRLPQPFIAACDAWLSQGVETSRAQLGERWLDVYLTGPIWRFAWAPGVVDAQWWVGVLMPSVDKVGRYFPLLVAGSADAAPTHAAALADWYAHVGAAALNTLQGGATLEAFESALARAPVRDGAPAAALNAAALPGRVRYTASGGTALSAWLQGLSLADGLQRYAAHSFWWPDHAHTPDASLSIAPGLPAPEHFAQLLGGRW